jgi:hypothetical protein
MAWGEVAFDTDLTAHVLGDLVGAPASDAGDVELGRSTGAHVVMIAARNATLRRPERHQVWLGGSERASAGVVQSSTRRGPWFSFAAKERRWPRDGSEEATDKRTYRNPETQPCPPRG